ncbi:Hypothetical predicted protein, partial [Pelobates cultripes]
MKVQKNIEGVCPAAEEDGHLVQELLVAPASIQREPAHTARPRTNNGSHKEAHRPQRHREVVRQGRGAIHPLLPSSHSPPAVTASQDVDSFPSTLATLSPTPSIMSEPQQTQEGEWRAKLQNLLTKADFEALSDRLGRVVREEVAQLHADLANVEACMS